MVLFNYVIILVIHQMVCSARTISKQSYSEILTKKCPNLLQKEIVKGCLNATVVDISLISDENKEQVLCTIYLYHLSEFSNKLSSHYCNETLLFPIFEENEKICSEPNFLLLNETNFEKELKILSHKCSKLCFNWGFEVDKKCELAHYYNNFKFDSQNNIDEHNVIYNNLKNSNALTESSSVMQKKLEGIHNEQNTKINNDGINQIVGKVENGNADPIVDTSQIVDSSHHVEEKIISRNNDDAHENVVTNLNNVDKGISNSSVNDNSSIPKIIKQNKQSLAQLTTEKTELNGIEDEDQDQNHPVFEDDAGADTDNLGQEFTKDDPGKMEKPNTVAGDTPVNSLNTDMDGKSYFFSYFLLVCILFVMGYIFYHNRVKVMALVLEGKKNKRQHRKRRPNSANYHKLDSNLEEALSSNCDKNTNQIIY